MNRIRLFGLFLIVGIAGCKKAPDVPPAPEPQAQNAVTDHFDRARQTMDRAQQATDKINSRIQAQDQQATQLGE